MFEYCVVDTSRYNDPIKLMSKLNRLGDDGWLVINNFEGKNEDEETVTMFLLYRPNDLMQDELPDIEAPTPPAKICGNCKHFLYMSTESIGEKVSMGVCELKKYSLKSNEPFCADFLISEDLLDG